MSTGLIPSKLDTCALNLYVSEVDCSPSKLLANQISAEHTSFDKAKLALGGYTLLTVKYQSEESISGFQFELEIPKHHSRVVHIGTKIGTQPDQSSECESKNFIVFNSKNSVIGIFDPEVSGSLSSTGYNLSPQNSDTTLCYILLEKSKSYTSDELCPEEIFIKNIKACRNFDTSVDSVLSSPKKNWTGKVSSNTGLSDIYFASKLFATKTYDRRLDANNDGVIDIVDITTLANKRHNLLFDKSNLSVLPEYICADHKEFVTKSDLSSEMSIMSTDIRPNEENSDLYDLHITIGMKSSNSTAGFQLDIGKDIFNDRKGKEKVQLLGPLKLLENEWAYKYESFKNRFDRDGLTRFMAYQLPVDVNDVLIKNDLDTLEQVLSVNSMKPLKTLTPVLKYSVIGCSFTKGSEPEPRFYYADEFSSSTRSMEEIKKASRKGERYYGRTNKREEVYYTGAVYNPKTSRRLTLKWDCIELHNERIVTNDFVNYYEHQDNNLKYSGFDLAYNINESLLSKHFDNNLESYFKYLINYLYLPLRNGLSSQFSSYVYEPSSSANAAHSGYISDAGLDGRKDIADTVSLVNIATQKLSSVRSSDLKLLQELAKNESHLSDHETSNSSANTTICDDEGDSRYNLRSLTKIVPTFVLENFTNTTFPHHKPSIIDQNTEAATTYFSDKVDVSGSNHPPEFKNWSEYFNDLHGIKYWELPEENEFSFVKVNLSTNTSKLNFITSTEFVLDFSNAYASLSGKKFWVYPGSGFPSSSYNLVVRASSSSGSQLPATGSVISADGKLFIKLEITGSNTHATSITNDGGPLNFINLFFTSIPDYIDGNYINFSTSPSSGSVESVGKPLDRAGSTDYLKYTSSDRLVYGPKLSFLSSQFKENSTSHKVFGDAVLRLRAVGPSSIDVEYDVIKPFNSASFDFRAINGIEATIDNTIYLPSQAGYTASISNALESDGVTRVTIYAPPGNLLSGSGELLRLKTDRQLFPYDVLQSGKEIMTPPKGETGDLIIPNVVKSSVFPQVSSLVFHIDASSSYWHETVSNGSDDIIRTIANPYGIANMYQPNTSSMPILTNASSSFKSGVKYISFNSTGSLQLLSSSISNSDLDSFDLEKFTMIAVINPSSFEGNWTKTIFKATSSVNSVTLSIKGKTTVPSEGAITLITSGSSGGTSSYDMNFSSTDYVGNDGHLLVITSDGSDLSSAASNIRLNGKSITSSFSALSSSGAQKVKFILGGEGTNHENFFYGNIGEVIFFNDVLSDSTIEVFEGYAAHKWGIDNKLLSTHEFYNNAPNVSNTTINNAATKAAIKKSEEYFPGSGSSSDREGSRLFSKYAGLSDVTITSGSVDFVDTNYDDLRELPKEINLTSSAPSDTQLFINSYDERTGLLEIGYSSVRKVDGYWLQLGNTYSGSSGLLSKQVGIIGKDKKDNVSQCYRKKWSQYVGYGPNELGIYNKDPRKVKSIKQIAFGFAQGLVGKSKNIPKDYYRNSGSWYIPSTPKGETGILTRLRVDPSSFKGTPTVSSYKLVTNSRSVNPTSSWTGDSSGGIVGFDDLNDVIKYAQYGFYNTGSSIPAIASESVKYDAVGSGSNIGIVDVLSVFNHLVVSNGAAATDVSLRIVPQDCGESLVTAPGTPTVSASAAPCASGSAVTVTWQTGSGGLPSGYEVWRRGTPNTSNKLDRSKMFLYTGDRDALYKKTASPYEKIKTLYTSSILSYTDKQPPYNDNCCEDSDNPEIDYIIIAFNEGGESTGNSNTVQLSCCNEIPVARDIYLTSSINTPITFTADVTEPNAGPPFGSASIDSSGIEELTFRIINYGNGSLDDTKNNDGIFTFKPDRDYLGKTTITYEVSNEAGCSAKASAHIQFTPPKFPLVCTVMKPMLNNSMSLPIMLQWDREDVRGNILKYEVFRALSGSSYSGTAIHTISGKLPVTERHVSLYDTIEPSTSSISYKYKVKAWGFQGDANEAIANSAYSTIETDDHYVTIPSRLTGSNPVVTVSSSNHVDSNHPLVKLSWPSSSVGSRDVQYYKIYRTFGSDTQYKKSGIVEYNSSSSYFWYDQELPEPDKINKYGIEDYVVKYRLTSVSDDGENGNPNNNWTGNTYSASISGSAIAPIVKDKTFSVCSGISLAGTVSDLIYNNAVGSTTFSSSALSGLSFSTSTGDFTYSNTTPGNVSFNYSATSGTKTSADGIITIRVLDCDDLTTPDGDDAKHIITDSYKIQSQRSKAVDQVPFGLKEKGGQNIRNSSKPYAVSKGKIDTSED